MVRRALAKLWMGGLLVSVAWGAVTAASAAEQMCVEIVGVNQGDFGGEAQSAACGKMAGFEYHHLVDSSQGVLRGRDVIFTKATDEATVNLWKALDDREQLSSVTFQFFRNDPDTGELVHYHTVILERAYVEAIEPYMADLEDPDVQNLPVRERVRLTYDALRIRFEPEPDETELRF